MKLFKQAADKIRSSPFIIPVGLVFITMLIISISLFWEDYWTSYYGYIMFPTEKANWWIPYMVALMPQVLQIGLTYFYLDDTDRRPILLLIILCHLADISTDIWFKINGNFRMDYLLIAFGESEILYTLGSELMLTISFGMIIKIFPDFWREISYVFKPIREIFMKIFRWFIPELQREIDTYRPRNEKPQRDNTFRGYDGYRNVNLRRNEKPQHRPYNNFQIDSKPDLDEIENEDDVREVIDYETPIQDFENKRKAGRPKGSKNKGKFDRYNTMELETNE